MPWLLTLLLAQVTNPAAIVTVARGEFSRISEAREVVVRTPQAWEALWKTHAPSQAAPAVGFATEAVVAVFLGSRPTGGFSVEITEIRREADALVIEYVERRPNRGEIVTQVETSPFHLARMPLPKGPIRFVKQTDSSKDR